MIIELTASWPPKKKMRLDSSAEEAGSGGNAEDPLKTEVSWMVKLQTEHCCKTGLHPPSSIGCFSLGPNQCTPFQPVDLSEWAMALVSYTQQLGLNIPWVNTLGIECENFNTTGEYTYYI